MTRMTGPDCAVMCNLIMHALIPPWEDQCEWHRMTRMTGPDCAVMCSLINIHTYIHKCIRTYIHTYINTYIHTYIHTYKHTYIHIHIFSGSFVLTTKEITVTQQVSHRPIECQSPSWPQRGTKVNGSHRRYFQHAHFIPIVGVGKRGAY